MANFILIIVTLLDYAINPIAFVTLNPALRRLYRKSLGCRSNQVKEVRLFSRLNSRASTDPGRY